jgi:hypothetical protein
VEQTVAFQNFIVLGIIPGTDIQINFQLWLLAIAAALSVVAVLHYARVYRFKSALKLVPTIGGDILTIE